MGYRKGVGFWLQIINWDTQDHLFSVWYLQHDITVSQGAFPSVANLCPGASCHCASRAKLFAIGSWNGMSSDKVLYQRLKCTTIPRRDVLLEFPSTGGSLENRFEVFAYLCLASWTFFPFLSGGSTHNLHVVAKIEIILENMGSSLFVSE